MTTPRILLGILVILVAGWFIFGTGPLSGRDAWPTQFQSNGERIYFTGTSASGRSISPQGRGMHMQMMGGGCASCHGGDRQGRQLRPQFWKSAPPLTAAALFGEHGDDQAEDGHGDHDGYTDETLRRAIIRGVDPSEKALDPAMPRWSISEEDMGDLIAYLRGPVDTPH